MRLGSDWRISVAAAEAHEQRQTSKPVEAPAPPAAPRTETRAVSTVDGISLPADYVPVFGDLWPGHVPAKKRRVR